MKKLILIALVALSINAFSQGALVTPVMKTLDVVHDGGAPFHGDSWVGDACTALDPQPEFKIVARAIVTYEQDLGRAIDAPCVFNLYLPDYTPIKDKKGKDIRCRMRLQTQGSTEHQSIFLIFSNNGDIPVNVTHFFVVYDYPAPSTGHPNSASGNCFPEGVDYSVNGCRPVPAAEAGVILTSISPLTVTNNPKGLVFNWTPSVDAKYFVLQGSTDKIKYHDIARIDAKPGVFQYSFNMPNSLLTGVGVLALFLPFSFKRRKLLLLVLGVGLIILGFACKKDNVAGSEYYRVMQVDKSGNISYINQ